MRNWIFSLVPLAAVVLSRGGTDDRAACDGGGVAITPYGSTETVTAAQVARNLEAASGLARAAGGRFDLGMARIAPDGLRPGTRLVGRTPGGVAVAYPLGEVERIEIVKPRAADGRVLVRASLFPALTPARLVALQPTYTTLDKDYRKTVPILLDARCKLIGNGIDAKGDPVAKGHYLRALPPGTVIDLIVAENWWAIPSVVDDPRYPRRATGA